MLMSNEVNTRRPLLYSTTDNLLWYVNGQATTTQRNVPPATSWLRGSAESVDRGEYLQCRVLCPN